MVGANTYVFNKIGTVTQKTSKLTVRPTSKEKIYQIDFYQNSHGLYMYYNL